MKEVVSSPEEVAARLAGSTVPGLVVIGPNVDESFGVTARHNGSSVHLSLNLPYWRIMDGDRRGRIDGRLFLDPVPEDENVHPLADSVRELSPDNCALIDLPKDYRISTGFDGRRQAVWDVNVIIAGPGAARGTDIRQAVFYIIPRS